MGDRAAAPVVWDGDSPTEDPAPCSTTMSAPGAESNRTTAQAPATTIRATST